MQLDHRGYIYPEHELFQLTQQEWIVVAALFRIKDERQSSKIPGWACYNSLLSENHSMTWGLITAPRGGT